MATYSAVYLESDGDMLARPIVKKGTTTELAGFAIQHYDDKGRNREIKLWIGEKIRAQSN